MPAQALQNLNPRLAVGALIPLVRRVLEAAQGGGTASARRSWADLSAPGAAEALAEVHAAQTGTIGQVAEMAASTVMLEDHPETAAQLAALDEREEQTKRQMAIQKEAARQEVLANAVALQGNACGARG